MPDIHIPKLGEHGGGKSIVKVALEVILISVGVFLGLAGEQWRENARHRELAEYALRRFRTEIVANHKSIAAVQDYHLARREELHAAIEAAAQNREPNSIHLSGIQPTSLEHTAWELALRQPSLAYIDTNLAYSLSQIYQAQERLDALGRGLSQAMYVNPPAVKPKEFGAVSVYYDDASIMEPQLATMYDAILPRLDKALGETPAQKKPSD